MTLLGRLGSAAFAVAVLTGITAVYYGLVVWGNIEAYEVNHGLVERVLAMDTLFQDEHLQWRAVTDGTLVHAVYVAIIVWQALITLGLVAAVVTWIRAIVAGPGAGAGRFALARRLSTLGWTMVILLFAGGFVAIGGEWFLLWQSEFSGALSTAVNNALLAAVGIVLAQVQRLEAADPAG